MTYKALYRTYRPKTFDDVVGQNHIVETLKNIISSNKLGHAYLFSGPRGTGKTSVAHLFARALNKNAAGDDYIDDLDIIEIDAASNNGIDEIRKIIDNAYYAPTKAKYKVYIVDEVHMLTKGAFNALLKILEEPPMHVVFILATTEIYKIPLTIISRCQRFNFKRINIVDIKDNLKKILKKENIDFDDESLNAIAYLSQGAMRDALSIVDQVSAYSNSNISFKAISELFGVVSNLNQIQLINLAWEGNSKELIKLTKKLIDDGIDIERASISLLGIIKDFIIFNKTQDDNLLENINLEQIKFLKINISYAYEFVDVLMKLISDLKFSEMPKQSFELALLKISKSNNVENMNTSENFSNLNENFENNKSFIDENFNKNERDLSLKELNENFNFQNLIDSSKEKTSDSFFNKENQIEEMNINLTSEQEISFNKNSDDIKNEEISKIKEEEKEIEEMDDLINLFKSPLDINEDQDKILVEHTNNEILNLFLQSSKDILNFSKEKWNNLLSIDIESKYIRIVNLLSETKIVAAGENFILVATEDKEISNEINDEYESQDFFEFTNNLFGYPVFVYSIVKKQFEEVKQLWIKLSSQNSLPQPKIILKPNFIEKEKTEAEELGNILFGDLFKS